MTTQTIVFYDHEVLCIQRQDNEMWTLLGGKFEDNKMITQTAKREILKETDLKIRVLDSVSIYQLPEPFMWRIS